MTLTWLPYGGARPTQHRFAEQSSSSTSPFLPLLARPPAPSLRPAVAIPSLLAAFLIGTLAWASRQVATTSSWAAAEAAPQSPLPSLAVSPAFPEPVRRWSPEIGRWADEFGLPIDLVAVVMTLESCGDPSVRSGAGAEGLFQVMPFHFAADDDPYDPEVNARRGLTYLSRGLQLAAGNAALALAGYNGGHGLIERDPATWPAETARYVSWGSGILGDLGAGITPSPTLQAWLDAGGASLCRRAAERPLS